MKMTFVTAGLTRSDSRVDSYPKCTFEEIEASKVIKTINGPSRIETFHCSKKVLKRIEFATHNLSSSSQHKLSKQRSVHWVLIYVLDL